MQDLCIRFKKIFLIVCIVHCFLQHSDSFYLLRKLIDVILKVYVGKLFCLMLYHCRNPNELENKMESSLQFILIAEGQKRCLVHWSWYTLFLDQNQRKCTCKTEQNYKVFLKITGNNSSEQLKGRLHQNIQANPEFKYVGSIFRQKILFVGFFFCYFIFYFVLLWFFLFVFPMKGKEEKPGYKLSSLSLPSSKYG